ncbi:MAG: hypothetical protein HY332_02680 [Chloroflexi bacterium]|nr:hypothetical protein [Chloroflexota bacterium]
MGLGKLNVFVSQLDDGCKIDSRTWFVTIYDCDGRVLEWCGRRYAVIPARCGHLEVEVPPGCYTLLAVWSFGTTPAGTIFGNHFTDHAVAQVCCDQTTCVTLYTPSAHRCGILFDVALRVLEQRREGGPPPEVVQRAREGIREVLNFLPRPARPLELGHLDELLGALEKPPPEREPRREDRSDP